MPLRVLADAANMQTAFVEDEPVELLKKASQVRWQHPKQLGILLKRRA
jgi:hypothetical protein